MKGPVIKPLAKEPQATKARSLLTVNQIIDFNECQRLLAMHITLLPQTIDREKIRKWVRTWALYVGSGGLLKNMGIMNPQGILTPVELGKGLETKTLWLKGVRYPEGKYWRANCDNGYKLNPYPDTWATRLVGVEMQSILEIRGGIIGEVGCEFSDLAAVATALPLEGPTFIFSTTKINNQYIRGGANPIHRISIRSNAGTRVNHYGDLYGELMYRLEGADSNYAEFFTDMTYEGFMANPAPYLARHQRVLKIKKKKFKAADQVVPDWFHAHAALNHPYSPLSTKGTYDRLLETMASTLGSSLTSNYPCAAVCGEFLHTSGLGVPVNTAKIPTKIGVTSSPTP